MKIFTIGFTKTTAEDFFRRLKNSGFNRIIDIRLNNVSQLAGFAKRDDLKYFSKEICDVSYKHEPKLAPTQDILDNFKKYKGSWKDYENKFLNLMANREIEKNIFNGACLLCSEDTPHYCHRRLVAEYLQKKWNDVEIIHL